MKTENKLKADAHMKYCMRHDLPFYPPYSGICWNCGENIWERYPVNYVANNTIGFCPVCKESFTN